MVKANRGSGGVDGQSLAGFAAQLGQQLDRLQSDLKEDAYQPQPVRQVQIPKAGKPGEFRTLGIPTIYDRVCQQALLNRLEPIFEPVFDEAILAHRRLGYVDLRVLHPQPPEDPPGRVPLLAMHLAVGFQNRIDQRHRRRQFRFLPFGNLAPPRHGASQRLSHHPPVDPQLPGHPFDRLLAVFVLAAYLFK